MNDEIYVECCDCRMEWHIDDAQQEPTFTEDDGSVEGKPSFMCPDCVQDQKADSEAYERQEAEARKRCENSPSITELVRDGELPDYYLDFIECY